LPAVEAWRHEWHHRRGDNIKDAGNLLPSKEQVAKEEAKPPMYSKIAMDSPIVLGGIMSNRMFTSQHRYSRADILMTHQASSGEKLTKADFGKIWSDPGLLEDFRYFAVSEFTVENVLFYQAYRRTQVMRSCSSKAWRDEFLHVYEQFFAPDADMELNLTDGQMRRVREAFFRSDFGEDVFDEAARAVYGMMQVNTYKRYMKAYNERK